MADSVSSIYQAPGSVSALEDMYNNKRKVTAKGTCVEKEKEKEAGEMGQQLKSFATLP